MNPVNEPNVCPECGAKVSPRPAIPKDLETICLKCLSKDDKRRYDSARSLVDDLRRFDEDQPIQARPVGATERLWRWCQRHPAVAGLLAALAVSLLAGLGAVLWQWQRAESRVQAENQQRRRAETLVEQVELQHVENLLRVNDTATTLVRLARLLRWNPTNRVVAATGLQPPAPMELLACGKCP